MKENEVIIMAKILVVDDDINIRELVRLFLCNEGFDVLEAEDGKAALKLLEKTKVDMAVLDIMMPNIDGYELCGEIREGYDIPVLMLTVMNATEQKVKGFSLGADDYMVKPFDPVELVARVKVLLNRYKINASQVIGFGNVTVNKKTHEVFLKNQRINLPLKEFELLYKLACNLGQTISRERLIESLWGYDFDGNERTLDVHIGKLRERFPENISAFKIITARGIGYRIEESL